MGSSSGEHARNSGSAALDERARVRPSSVFSELPRRVSAPSQSTSSMLSDLQNCGASNIRKIMFGCFIRLCASCIMERYVIALFVPARKYLKGAL